MLTRMRIPRHPTLVRRFRDARVKQLARAKSLLAGSLVRIAKHCGRAGCRCQPARRGGRGEKHVGWYLTRYHAGKTQTTYVPVDLVREVRAWVKEHRRVRGLVQDISELNRALIRLHVTEKERRRGRS